MTAEGAATVQWVPPVYSPVPWRALARGLRAAGAGGEEEKSELRRRLREEYGCERVVLTDSGTSALALALKVALSDGGERGIVALPAYSCYDLVTALRGAGAPRAVLYDLDPETLGPDPESLSEASKAGARVVVVVHLYGCPVDLESVADLLEGEDTLLIEDAAQGIGGRLAGRPLGATGPLSVLSFGRGKGLTGGRGGALLAHGPTGTDLLERSAEVDDRLPARRGVGALLGAAAQALLGRPGVYAFPSSLPFLRLGETVYRPPHPPRGLPAACAATILGTWDASFEEARLRRERARSLRRHVEDSAVVRGVRIPARGEAGYLRLPVVARSEKAARRLSGRRARAVGVSSGYPRTLDALPAFPGAGPSREDRTGVSGHPGARALTRRLFTLPVHGRLSARHQRRIRSLIRS